MRGQVGGKEKKLGVKGQFQPRRDIDARVFVSLGLPLGGRRFPQIELGELILEHGCKALVQCGHVAFLHFAVVHRSAVDREKKRDKMAQLVEIATGAVEDIPHELYKTREKRRWYPCRTPLRENGDCRRLVVGRHVHLQGISSTRTALELAPNERADENAAHIAVCKLWNTQERREHCRLEIPQALTTVKHKKSRVVRILGEAHLGRVERVVRDRGRERKRGIEREEERDKREGPHFAKLPCGPLLLMFFPRPTALASPHISFSLAPRSRRLRL